MPQGRLAVTSYVIVGMIALLLFGFWKLQIIDSDRYSQLAERNRVRSIPIIAPRGTMLDREGRVLVDNYPSFSVLLLRDDPAQVEKNLPAISEGLDIPLSDLKEQLLNSRNLKNFQPIVIKPEASKADVAFIDSHRTDIPLLEMLMVHRRRYLPGGFMAHASGYVGEVSEQQIEASNGRFRPGDFVGKSGLEKQYNALLQGTDGMRRVGAHRHANRKILARPGKIAAALVAAPEQQKLDRADPAPQLSAVLAEARQQYVLAQHCTGNPDGHGFLAQGRRESAEASGALQCHRLGVEAPRQHHCAVERDQLGAVAREIGQRAHRIAFGVEKAAVADLEPHDRGRQRRPSRLGNCGKFLGGCKRRHCTPNGHCASLRQRFPICGNAFQG